ncbi:hypothetical protein [Pseudidiomarina andamanensis]|uniref:Uncharacterized protein n=1 Tax=Pseudidiomarina andamanensis TaxID=1940690 RepID=A0AA92ESG9_9GAMM|nr:hypothetical protein [Pseudidiomarina andamanensis]MDS0218542.1 hypothetical protein [Pseudidiomarina andamanensis]QGT95411.1 hypothetical protein D3795_04130 [Pseudidiomarina andamanensis]
MKTTTTTRISALAIMVLGILLAVLAPANEAASSYRQLGVVLLVVGAVWLLRQKRPEPAPEKTSAPYQQPVLKWYQSPILWVPIIAIIIAILSWLLI